MNQQFRQHIISDTFKWKKKKKRGVGGMKISAELY